MKTFVFGLGPDINGPVEREVPIGCPTIVEAVNLLDNYKTGAEHIVEVHTEGHRAELNNTVSIRYDDAPELSGKKLRITYNSNDVRLDMTDGIFDDARIVDEAGVYGNAGPFEMYDALTGIVYLTSEYEGFLNGLAKRTTRATEGSAFREFKDAMIGWGDGANLDLKVRPKED